MGGLPPGAGMGQMKVKLKLKPNDPGTKKLTAKYGDRLLSVRYRYDAENNRRITTVELSRQSREKDIVWLSGIRVSKSKKSTQKAYIFQTETLKEEEIPWKRRTPDNKQMSVKIQWDETELQEKAKEAGGRWDPNMKVWNLPYEIVRKLKLQNRIMGK
jgi:hypothetical protein